MNLNRVLTLILVAIVAAVCAPGAHAAKRVLLVGDSWAQLMWKYKSLSTNFKAFGVGQHTEDGSVTAIGGTTAAIWAANTGIIQQQLILNPTIDCVNLVLGGNDLWVWNTGWSQAQTDAHLDTVKANLNTICQAALAVRPNIKVVLHGYDYINLWDTVVADPFGQAGLLWAALGQPTPAQLNGLFAGLEQRKIQLAQGNSRIKYVQCFGTLQVVGGTSAAIPGQAPSYAPFPGGNPALPTPVKYFPLTSTRPKKYDPIHLTQEGYKWHSWMATAAFYQPYFVANP